MDIGDMLMAVLTGANDGDGSGTRVWRVTMASLMVGGYVVGGFHIAWVCGMLAWAGLPGFVQASELDKTNISISQALQRHEAELATQNKHINELILIGLDQQIKDNRKRQCRLEKAIPRDQDLLDDVTGDLSREMEQYRRLDGGYDYRIPSCEEL